MHNCIEVGARSVGVMLRYGLAKVHGDNASSSARIEGSKARMFEFKTRARRSEYCESRMY